MEDNPYQSPAELSKQPLDILRLPALACLGFGFVGVIAGSAHVALSIYLLQVVQDEKYYRDRAQLLIIESFVFTAACVLGMASAVCMFRGQCRWLVVLSCLIGIATCIPAPLAVIVLMRLWRKEVWNSFRTENGESKKSKTGRIENGIENGEKPN